MNEKRDSIVARYDYNDNFYNTDTEWLAYSKKRTADIATIQWSGRLALILISVAGLFVFFRRQRIVFGFRDYIMLFTGMFFMKDAAMDLLGLVFGTGVVYETWLVFGLPYSSVQVSIVLAFLLFLFILYKIPKDKLKMLVLASIIGISSGAYIWYKGMAAVFPAEAQRKHIQKNQVVKDFTAIMHGSEKEFRFSDYRDSIVVIDFMFTTCSPCRYSIPHINKLYNRYRPQGVVFFGVDPIEKDWTRLKRFLEVIRVNYPILKIREEISDQTFGVRSFPTIAVINCGKLILICGGHESSIPKIEMALNMALKNKQ